MTTARLTVPCMRACLASGGYAGVILVTRFAACKLPVTRSRVAGSVETGGAGGGGGFGGGGFEAAGRLAANRMSRFEVADAPTGTLTRTYFLKPGAAME